MRLCECNLEELEGDRVANKVLEGYRSTGFRRGIFFLLDPFLEATFQDPPLSAHLKRWDLPILDHTMQSSFGDFEYVGGFSKGQKSNGSISLFHKFCLLLKTTKESKSYATWDRRLKWFKYNTFAQLGER